MMRLFTLILAAAATFLAGCEVLPVATAPGPAPLPTPALPAATYPNAPPPAADYRYQDLRDCRSDNQRAHAAVQAEYDQARRAGRINPAEAQQFAAMESRLRELRYQLGRDGLTLQECRYLGAEIQRMREQVARMARHDRGLRQCLADNRRAHQEVYALYDNARRANRITPGEARRFAAIDSRLSALRGDLERPGMTLADCQRIGGAIANEREEVLRMSRSDPGVRRCMADNQRAHDDIYRIYNGALNAGRISPGEAQRFRAMDARLQRFQADLRRDGLTLDECHRLGNALARERAAVEAMGRY